MMPRSGLRTKYDYYDFLSSNIEMIRVKFSDRQGVPVSLPKNDTTWEFRFDNPGKHDTTLLYTTIYLNFEALPRLY